MNWDCCPTCGYTFDCQTHVSDKTVRPKPGNLTLCLNCAVLLRFDDDMQTVPVTDAEAQKLHPRHLALVLKAQREIKKRGPLTQTGGSEDA